MFFAWGSGPVIAELPWVNAVFGGALLLGALLVALLAFGRYYVVRDPLAYWAGLGFTVSSVLLVFYILTWPGLLPGRPLADLSNTSAWFSVLAASLLAGCLLVAGSGRWLGQPSCEPALWSVVPWVGGTLLISGLSIAFERALPVLVTATGGWTTTMTVWQAMLTLAYGGGVVLSMHQYRISGDRLPVCVALSQLVLAFAEAGVLIGGKRYDLWWYLVRVLMVGGFLTMIGGLLAEYVTAFRREQVKTQEADRARAALRQSEERFRALVTASSDVLFRLSPDGSEMRQVQGRNIVPDATTPSRTWLQTYVPPEDQSPVVNAIQAAGRAKSLIELEHRFIRADGSVGWAFSRAVPLLDAHGDIVEWFGAASDITERKRIEAEADRLHRELAHMARVTLMGELTGSLAHELNQPLTAIASNAHVLQRLLAQRVPPLGEVNEATADIAADALRAGEVIRRLQHFLTKDAKDVDRFRALDVNLLIREVEALTRTDSIIRHHPIALALAPDLPSVRGDRIQLQQVLLNLVLNGTEAMEPQPPAARQLGIQTLAVGRAVRVGVQDQAPGIPPDKLETIFDTFFTTKPHGMGMGLAISRSIVEAHGGRIWAENNPERGATFWFSLPV